MRIIRGVLGFSGVILAVTLFVPACGGSGGAGALGVDGSGGSDTSGVDGSKKLIALTDAENGTLCDWMVARAGSYGNPGTCHRTPIDTGYTPFLAYDDQAACIFVSRAAIYKGCEATVAQLEACVKTLPACATYNDENSSPACASISNC